MAMSEVCVTPAFTDYYKSIVLYYSKRFFFNSLIDRPFPVQI